jgi:hypothetical protein
MFRLDLAGTTGAEEFRQSFVFEALDHR